MEQQIKSTIMEHNIKFMLRLCDLVVNDNGLGNYQFFINLYYNNLNECYEFGNGLKIHRTTMETIISNPIEYKTKLENLLPIQQYF
jgi:hypothetical protein